MKANLKILTALIIVILVIGGVVLATRYQASNKSIEAGSTAQTSTANPATTITQVTEKTSASLTPIAPYKLTNSNTKFLMERDSITNPQTGQIITFKGSPSESGTLMVTDVFLDGKKIGTVGGYEASEPVFSLNYQYASFMTQGPEGASGINYYINVFDFKNAKIVTALTPQHFDSLENGENDVIESYSWRNSSDALDVTAFEIGIVNGKLYRVSPKQVWRYNLATRSYTLVQTL